MPKARKHQIDLNVTEFYLCTTTCVQHAFLCGEDISTGNNYEHRRQWIVDRLKFAAKYFAIEVCAFSIMHNHYHVIVRANGKKAKSFKTEEIIRRYTSIYPSTIKLVECLNKEDATESEQKAAKKTVKKWRKRLVSISWFMRVINESIAKQANKESDKKGHFWASRFHSEALHDYKALLSSMAYVDLNPVRAGTAKNLIDSDFTSIQERISILQEAQNQLKQPSNTSDKVRYQPKRLMPFTLNTNTDGIYFSLKDYLALVDWTGRSISPKKKGFINDNEPPLLETLELDKARWLEEALKFGDKFVIRDQDPP